MKRHEIEANDLHSVMAGMMQSYASKPGDVHFKAAGSKHLAEQVASTIKAALDSAAK